MADELLLEEDDDEEDELELDSEKLGRDGALTVVVVVGRVAVTGAGRFVTG